MPVVAITRELGTRGGDVARGVAERLKLALASDEPIEHDIARLSGYSTDAVHRYFQGRLSVAEHWRLDERHLSKISTEEILELAARGNVVIRGWAASYVLQNVPHVLCVRVCAPIRFRARVAKERGLASSTAEACQLIGRHDAANDRAMKQMFGRDGREATGYALTLNSDSLGVEACVDLIAMLACAPRFQASVESQRALLDWLTDLRVFGRHTV